MGTKTHATTARSEERASEIRPLGNMVLVRLLEVGTTTGGIIMPSGVRGSDKHRALVLAVGSGRIHATTGERIPLEVSPGEYVLMSPQASGARIERDKALGDVVLVSDDQILATEVFLPTKDELQ